MSAFLAKHFVATHMQLGNFEAITVKNKVKKQGGNVVSYFCTPEGRVIHFVLGPASAKRLLREGEWAVATYQQAKVTTGGDVDELAKTLSEAHKTRKRSGSQRKVREYLAQKPFPFIGRVQVHIFEELLDEKVSRAGPYVEQAAKLFEAAKERSAPVVLFLYESHKESARKRYLEYMTKPEILGPLARCVVVSLPLEELPALSALLDIPAYTVDSKRDPIVVVADPEGKQLGSVSGRNNPEELGRQLRSAVRAMNERRLAEAKQADE